MSEVNERILFLEAELEKEKNYVRKMNHDRLVSSHLLYQVDEELQEALVNEKRFIASVSHELRTPLTAILGYSELLEDTALNNKQNRYLESIIQSSNHLLSLVSDLLDVAKLGDNRVELNPKEVDLDDILTDCTTLIRSKVAKDVDFVIDIPMLEYKVQADDKRIKQICINLLSNAAKFTKKGSINFSVTKIEELINNEILVQINVKDTGDGIPESVKDTLFDPFQSTDKTQGTGLGLFISKQIAGLMNGEITVTSQEGVGSNFTFTMVLEKASKKEIGKELKNSHIMMFSQRNSFVEKISREFMNLSVNFHNHDVNHGEIASTIIQMVASGKFYDIAIFDVDIFKNHTDDIAGTLKLINPDIKLIALADEQNDKNLSEFDLSISKAVPYQKFIKNIEDLYSQELFDTNEEVDYADLDILIVEDVEMNREYEKEMLNSFFSISCDTAEHGAIALEKAKAKFDNNEQYDAILMDMRMPVMDGLEATRRIRMFDKKTPIICMSANVYKEDRLAAQESGMNDFIEKPLERTDIENKLLKLINHEFDNIDKEMTLEDKFKTVEVIAEVECTGEKLKELALKHLNSNFNDTISNTLFGKALLSIKKYSNNVTLNIEKKDTKELVEDFHALKGVLSNIGLKELANEAGELQKISEADDFMLIVNSKDKIMDNVEKLLAFSNQ